MLYNKNRLNDELQIYALGTDGTVAVFQSQPAQACTGITLTAKDSTRILARTIEWGGSDLNSCYVVVPRGYTVQSYVPADRMA